MGRPRYNPRPDANQQEMIEDLEALGLYVFNVSPFAPIGCDLVVVGYHRDTHRVTALLVEVKREGHGDDLTEREAEVRRELMQKFGLDAPYLVATKTEDVLREFGAV